MEIAVVGFTRIHPGLPAPQACQTYTIPKEEEDLHSILRSLLNNKSVGLMVVDSTMLTDIARSSA